MQAILNKLSRLFIYLGVCVCMCVTMSKKKREAFNLMGDKGGVRKGWEGRKGRNNVIVF